MKVLFVFFCFFTLIGCRKNLSDKEIMDSVWKCGQPCGLSDVIIFNAQTTIKNDTIFHAHKPYAKIVKRTSNFDEDTKISVINLDHLNSADTCIYHAK